MLQLVSLDLFWFFDSTLTKYCFNSDYIDPVAVLCPGSLAVGSDFAPSIHFGVDTIQGSVKEGSLGCVKS